MKKLFKKLKKLKALEVLGITATFFGLFIAYKTYADNLDYQKSQNTTSFELIPIHSSYNAFAKSANDSIKHENKYVLFFNNKQKLAGGFFFNIKNTGSYNASNAYMMVKMGFYSENKTYSKALERIPYFEGENYIGNLAPQSEVGNDYVFDLTPIMPDESVSKSFYNMLMNGSLEIKASFCY